MPKKLVVRTDKAPAPLQGAQAIADALSLGGLDM